MRTKPFKLLATLALASVVGGCDTLAEPLSSAAEPAVDVPPAVALSQVDGQGSPFLRVLTRNIYLGGETSPILSLDFSDIPGILAAVNTFWAQLEENDFHARAGALAEEIAMTDPHVVGLQEVARFALLDGSFNPVGGIDMLAVLMDALAQRGLDYEVAWVQENSTGTLPMSIDMSVGAPDLYMNFLIREATLVRGDVEVSDADGGNYAAKLVLPSPDNPVATVQRGWSRVTVDFRGVPHHVVNTHLEIAPVQPLHDLQADELVGQVLAGLDGVTVLLGDLNSDADGSAGEPDWTATYGKLMDAGFADAWIEAAGRESDGYTCCQDPDLKNEISALSKRIDFVLIRGAGEFPGHDGLPGAVHATIVGDESGDRTAEGLWPADHAGLFAALQIPRGLIRD